MATAFEPRTQMNRRILNFEGGCNFRDLGGYRTSDGRALAWGKVYRTGVLSYFTDADREPLRKLGVAAICDLRREPERLNELTRWPDERTRHLSFEDGPEPPTIRTWGPLLPPVTLTVSFPPRV